MRIVQVRYPLESVLAAWRHIFKNGGWKPLEDDVISHPKLFKKYEAFYSNIEWSHFVEEVVL